MIILYIIWIYIQYQKYINQNGNTTAIRVQWSTCIHTHIISSTPMFPVPTSQIVPALSQPCDEWISTSFPLCVDSLRSIIKCRRTAFLYKYIKYTYYCSSVLPCDDSSWKTYYVQFVCSSSWSYITFQELCRNYAGWVTHMCASEIYHHWLRWWYVAW